MNKFDIFETEHNGIYKITNSIFKDGRGYLEKFYEKDLFKKFDFNVNDIYTTTSSKNVVRGMHHQVGSYSQAKLITCLSGAFYDIALDLRKNSPKFGQIYYTCLSEDDNISLLIKPGFSHGTFSIKDQSVMLSICSGKYLPEFENGFNMKSLRLPFYNDNAIVSQKDRNYPDFYNE